jgi:hypothetical protein
MACCANRTHPLVAYAINGQQQWWRTAEKRRRLGDISAIAEDRQTLLLVLMVVSPLRNVSQSQLFLPQFSTIAVSKPSKTVRKKGSKK